MRVVIKKAQAEVARLAHDRAERAGDVVVVAMAASSHRFVESSTYR
jgi:hypothetical protein